MWERVRETLKGHRRKPKAKPTTRSKNLLAGLIFDDRGGAMSPAHAKKRSGKRYRYYVSQAVIKGEGGRGRIGPADPRPGDRGLGDEPRQGVAPGP